MWDTWHTRQLNKASTTPTRSHYPVQVVPIAVALLMTPPRRGTQALPLPAPSSNPPCARSATEETTAATLCPTGRASGTENAPHPLTKDPCSTIQEQYFMKNALVRGKAVKRGVYATCSGGSRANRGQWVRLQAFWGGRTLLTSLSAATAKTLKQVPSWIASLQQATNRNTVATGEDNS